MGLHDKINMFEAKARNQTVGDQRIAQGLARTRSARSRLDPAGLKAAGCETSHNPLVREIFTTVQSYNSEWRHPSTMNPQQRAHAITQLDYIYSMCASYMTTKIYKTISSKGTEAKRKQRYEAFDALIQGIASEITLFGGKTLVGPTNFRKNKRNYWLERVDPRNRAGFKISSKYKDWLQTGSDGQSFWQWLSSHGGPTIAADSLVAGYNNPMVAQWQFGKHFDANTTMLKSQDDSTFNTSLLKTEFSKMGWAVWVCSMKMLDEFGVRFGNYIFSNTHRAGWDHHSSFLGGKPVMAAGEWVVSNAGQIKVITAKSGHYMPSWENLQRFVTEFPEIPGDAIIRPNMLDHKDGTDTIKFYRVDDFRSRGLLATPLRRNVVLAQIAPANTDITEHFSGGHKKLTELLPP